ncbi:MAG: Signal transduction histidine kinase [Clostridia bacterium 41_269]|nr:MAG: Signal transduction histidine kinase [Clostridia bacterium 41_269]
MDRGVVFQDAGERILAANPAAEKILGFDEEKLLGHTFGDLQLKSLKKESSIEDKENSILVTRIFNSQKGVDLWIKARWEPILRQGDGTPHAFCIFLEDITERKRIEQELKEKFLAVELEREI